MQLRVASWQTCCGQHGLPASSDVHDAPPAHPALLSVYQFFRWLPQRLLSVCGVELICASLNVSCWSFQFPVCRLVPDPCRDFLIYLPSCAVRLIVDQFYSCLGTSLCRASFHLSFHPYIHPSLRLSFRCSLSLFFHDLFIYQAPVGQVPDVSLPARGEHYHTKNIFFNNMLTSPLLSALRKGGQVAVWRCRKIDTAASACNDE